MGSSRSGSDPPQAGRCSCPNAPWDGSAEAYLLHRLHASVSKQPSAGGGNVKGSQDFNCVFCRIIGGAEMVSIIHEDEDVIAFLDIQPLHPGHLLVLPKAHYKNLFYVPEDLAARTFAMARRLMPGLREATGCRAVNLFSPNGAQGGQDVFHFHLHLIPVPDGAPFPLQLPDNSAAVPTRSHLDVMAARIGRCVHDSVAQQAQHQ